MSEYRNQQFSTAKAAWAAGIGQPLLQKWQRLGYIAPDGKDGKDARWSYKLTLGIAAAEVFRKEDFPAQIIRQTLEFFASRTIEQIEGAIRKGHTELVVTKITAGILTKSFFEKILRDPRAKVSFFAFLDITSLIQSVNEALAFEERRANASTLAVTD